MVVGWLILVMLGCWVVVFAGWEHSLLQATCCPQGGQHLPVQLFPLCGTAKVLLRLRNPFSVLSLAV